MCRLQEKETHFVVKAVRRPAEILYRDAFPGGRRIDLEVRVAGIREEGYPQPAGRMIDLTGGTDDTRLENKAIVQKKYPR